jgi:hypothetical protein
MAYGRGYSAPRSLNVNHHCARRIRPLINCRALVSRVEAGAAENSVFRPRDYSMSLIRDITRVSFYLVAGMRTSGRDHCHHLISAGEKGIRNRLLYLDPGYPQHHPVVALQMLDVEGGDYIDTVKKLFEVMIKLIVPRAR